MACTFLLAILAMVLNWPLPLTALQLLVLNLVTDGLPALALGVEPVDRDVMNRPPRPTNEPVVTKQRAFLMLAQGAFIAVCSLTAFMFVYSVEKEGISRARTAAFIVLSCSQLFHSFNCRNFHAVSI
jgi:Ca2+-transporting ATPase